MALSRKREKELKHLRGAALALWNDQKDLLGKASSVASEVSRQAAHLSREEVAPRVRDAVDANLRPAIVTGIAASKSAAGTARDRVQNDVLPAVSSMFASALAAVEGLDDPRVKDAVNRVRDAGSRFSSQLPVMPQKRSSGAGRYLVVALIVTGVAGVAYAAWQTLRADDELWVSDDDASGAPA